MSTFTPNRILREALAILGTVLDRLALMARGGPSETGAELRRLCGELLAYAPGGLKTGDMGARLAACFATARKAGATAEDFARLRMSIEAMSATYAMGQTVLVAAIRFALIEESRALAARRFTSRAECEAIRERMNIAFDAAIEVAADRGEYAAMRALTALHSAVAFDLHERGRPLPRMIDYRMNRRMPSLRIAQRLYGEAAREPELVAENRPPHPLFMPAVGRALSE